jgi:hypothetical protein
MTLAPSPDNERTEGIETDVAAASASDVLFDPDLERVVAKELQGGRRRNFATVAGAVLVAAVVAAGYTIVSQDGPASPEARAAAAPPAPALAATVSAPVKLAAPDSDPNKVQERVAATAPDPAPAERPVPATWRAGQMPGDGVRRIPLGPNRDAEAAAVPQAATAFSAQDAALSTELTIPAAPLPVPRPSASR